MEPDESTPSRTHRMASWLEQLQLRRSRHLIAPSQTLAAVAQARGLDSVEVLRSPAFVEPTAHHDRIESEHLAERSYLLFVGRLERRKGIDALIAALPMVLREIPTAQMVFAGIDHDGSVRQRVQMHMPNEASRVHFLGALPHGALYPVVERARLVVLPSLVDNLPNAMLEAMALGIPVLGTYGASFDEVIEDGVSGFLVPPGDAERLATRIVQAWHAPDLRAIGLRGREVVAQFRPDVTTDAALTCYARASNRSRDDVSSREHPE